MAKNPIETIQLSHLLELLVELGECGDYFVLVGGRALAFVTQNARPTKDFDFILDVVRLHHLDTKISDVLTKLGYQVIKGASRFQFFKKIPNSNEEIRIELMATDKKKRNGDFRVDVQESIHARACHGADIVLHQCEEHSLEGSLPSGKQVSVTLRVIHPRALLMLKLLAMDDRYKNIRGPDESEHDRNEARIHMGDIANIVHEHIGAVNFRNSFWAQFDEDAELNERVSSILSEYFADLSSPGIQLYREFLRDSLGSVEEEDLRRTLREIRLLLTSGVLFLM